MKTTLRTILLLSFMALNALAYSQGMGTPAKAKARKEIQENVESMKIAYLTNKLQLSPEEAQKFWPVYNQYNEKLLDLRKKRKSDMREAKKNFEEQSEKDIDLAIENDFLYRQKELDIQKDYNIKFKSVLPIRKVAMLYRAEEQFKRVLIDKLKDNKKEGPEN